MPGLPLQLQPQQRESLSAHVGAGEGEPHHVASRVQEKENKGMATKKKERKGTVLATKTKMAAFSCLSSSCPGGGGMALSWVVGASLLAGVLCGLRTWYDWAGEVPLGRDFVGLVFSLRFWEALLEPALHKLLVLNAGTCMLYLLGRLLQESLLGPLREMEAMKAGDRIRSYALNKMVFIGAILQDHDEKEMMVWFVWLALVGFVRQLGLLVRDRLEYITLAVHTKTMDLAKIGVLLAILLIVNTFLLALCLRVAGCRPSECDVNTVGLLMLLLFECVVGYIDAAQTMLRVALYVINLSREGHWERRGLYSFYSELVCQLTIQFLSLFHFIHVWAVHGLSVTLTDFLLFLHTRGVVNKIRAKLASLVVFLTIDKRLPDATAAQLASANDSCAICREALSTAKVLPCGHMFHLVCLRDWLDQSATCPICRRPVAGEVGGGRVAEESDAGDVGGVGVATQTVDADADISDAIVGQHQYTVTPPHSPPPLAQAEAADGVWWLAAGDRALAGAQAGQVGGERGARRWLEWPVLRFLDLFGQGLHGGAMMAAEGRVGAVAGEGGPGRAGSEASSGMAEEEGEMQWGAAVHGGQQAAVSEEMVRQVR